MHRPTQSADILSTKLAFHASILVFLALLLSIGSSSASQNPHKDVSGRSRKRTSSGASARSKNKTSSEAGCHTDVQDEVTIACNYKIAPSSTTVNNSRVALDRAVISFQPEDSSNLLAELTFTNIGSAAVSDSPTVYLEIDDNAGNNYVRRALPTVDFRKLVPGQAQTFSERLRVAAFPPGSYTIALWIPSSEAALKFNAAHNFLISSEQVPDPKTGLNVLCKFSVKSWRK